MPIADIIAKHAQKEGALLPILNDVQAQYGHISDAAIRDIAAQLNLTRAEVYGVVSFYHDYLRTPAEHPVIKLCGAEACQARGVKALAEHAIAAADNKAEIETVYCLGLCSAGPAAMIGTDVYVRLDEAKMDALIKQVAP
ncbi:MAG: NAD(P)H-dependent oxidoreductase subunit E [Pseudomonadota bacterium]